MVSRCTGTTRGPVAHIEYEVEHSSLVRGVLSIILRRDVSVELVSH